MVAAVIKPNTCPYCGSRWDMLEACIARCADSQLHLALIRDALAEEMVELAAEEFA
jgi:hypothetical protein